MRFQGGGTGLVMTETEIYSTLTCSPSSPHNLPRELARAGTKMCLNATGQTSASQLLRASVSGAGAGYAAAAANCFRGAPNSATAAAASAAEASGGAVEGLCLGSRGRCRRGRRTEDQFRCNVARQGLEHELASGKVTADHGDGERRGGARGTKLSAGTSDASLDLAVVSEEAAQPLNVSVRVLYSLVMYGGMTLAGKFLCDAAGVDVLGGFRLDAEDFFSAWLFALVPIFGALVVHQDSVVERWAPARAMREAEDEEIKGFYAGMKTWQTVLIGSTAAVAEEVFFRAAVQGGLAHALHLSSKGGDGGTSMGMAALTGVLPCFAPFSAALAALLTAALTGSMYYIISSPRAFHEKEHLRTIYSPLTEALLALYLGAEWVLTGNLMAPVVTHGLYYATIVRAGLKRRNEENKKMLESATKSNIP